MEQRTCHCGESFAPGRSNQEYCSARCRKRAGRATERKRWWMASCSHCRRVFLFQARAPQKRRYCSAQCQADAKSERYRVHPKRERVGTARTRRARAALHRAAEGSAGRVVWVVGGCAGCGEQFTSNQPNASFCSRYCLRRAAKDRRRAAQRSAFVSPVSRKAIFERDGWRCQLCGCRLSRAKAVPHPTAATLDHVVPLAAGGTHEPANCQAACFGCNVRKSDGWSESGEQLRLIG